MKTIFLSGMARSGTSWLSKILAAHPDVLYHFEPFNLVGLRQDLPGYLRYWELLPALKKLVHQGRLDEALRQFAVPLDRFAQVRDHCLDRKPFFPQPADPKWMAIKEDFTGITELCGMIGQVVQIVRDPRAQLNSLWNNTEFGKYYGAISVTKCWRETGDRIFNLQEQEPQTYRVIQYERLCVDPQGEGRRLFEWLKIPWDIAVENFLIESTSRHESNAYHVFKNPEVPLSAWRTGLSATVAQSVIRAARGSRVAIELYNNFEGE